MRTTNSECKINGVQVREVTIKATNIYSSETLDYLFQLDAVYATCEVVDSAGAPNITTHGRCTSGSISWSKMTMLRLKALLASMEDDLLPQHFKTQLEEELHEGIKSRGLGEGVSQI